MRPKRSREKAGCEKKLEREKEKEGGSREQEKTEHKLLYKVLHSRNRCSVSHRILPTLVIVRRANARARVSLQDIFSRIFVERSRWSNIVLYSREEEKETYHREAIIAHPTIFLSYSATIRREQKTDTEKERKEEREGNDGESLSGDEPCAIRVKSFVGKVPSAPCSPEAGVLWHRRDFNIRLELMSASN